MAQHIDLGPEVNSMNGVWKSAIFISHQEAKRVIEIPLVWEIYAPLLRKEGSFIEACGLPDECFSDWNNRLIDLKIETLTDLRCKERLALLFFGGCAMGFLRNGQWFALRTLKQGKVARNIDAVLISVELAQRIVCFPGHWQDKVEFINELPEGRRLQSKA